MRAPADANDVQLLGAGHGLLGAVHGDLHDAVRNEVLLDVLVQDAAGEVVGHNGLHAAVSNEVLLDAPEHAAAAEADVHDNRIMRFATKSCLMRSCRTPPARQLATMT